MQEVSKVTAPGPDRLSSVQYHAPFPSGGILAHPTMPSESAAGKDRNVHQMLEEGPGDTISAAGSNRSDSVAPGVVAVQYEYEELQHRVHALNNENRFLKEELQKVSEECNKVTSENDSIKGTLMDKEGSVFAALLEEDSLAYSDSFICGSGLLDNTQGQTASSLKMNNGEDTWSLKVAPTDGEKDNSMHNGNSLGSSSLTVGSVVGSSFSGTNFSESSRSCSSGTSYSKNISEVKDGGCVDDWEVLADELAAIDDKEDRSAQKSESLMENRSAVKLDHLPKNTRPSTDDIPKEIVPLSVSCWAEDPADRPEFIEIKYFLEKFIHYLCTPDMSPPRMIKIVHANEVSATGECPCTSQLKQKAKGVGAKPRSAAIRFFRGFRSCF
ncbi:hypothetical protein DCAR_0519699 [Daucus carota subsp. sativus]|uniref:Serine-threonine/tyrosine-protein kinase catalytic domain-containing protein n=1 Tax=Daucus carota subsp. sativus TaxID=79200 RepID=A0A161XQV9_DAUCS|nr:hypothetical protein DCAR_0519699 [Daucus carota subsp. sativus]